MNQLMGESSSQVNLQTLEKNISDKVRCELDSIVVTVETRVHDAILSAMDNLGNPSVELAIRSANVSSIRNFGGVELDRDQRDTEIQVACN